MRISIVRHFQKENSRRGRHFLILTARFLRECILILSERMPKKRKYILRILQMFRKNMKQWMECIRIKQECIPARFAARIPILESSRTRQFSASTPKIDAPSKKISGSGFPCSTISPPTMESKCKGTLTV